MAEYQYKTASIGGHLQRSNISDISSQLLDKMKASIDEGGAEGLRPLSVAFEGGRMEAFDARNNPYTAQRIEYALLTRRDPSRWELDAHSGVNTWPELDARDGAVIDEHEADEWHLIGYYRGLNSATDQKAPFSDAIWDSVAVFTRRASPQ